MKRVDVRDIDLDHLEELDNDEFFTKKERVVKQDKFEEDRNDHNRKRSSLRKSRPN